jgi:hypothetical protein
MLRHLTYGVLFLPRQLQLFFRQGASSENQSDRAHYPPSTNGGKEHPDEEEGVKKIYLNHRDTETQRKGLLISSRRASVSLR